eukprot:5306648-Amphidinium_carterae.1
MTSDPAPILAVASLRTDHRKLSCAPLKSAGKLYHAPLQSHGNKKYRLVSTILYLHENLFAVTSIITSWSGF